MTDTMGAENPSEVTSVGSGPLLDSVAQLLTLEGLRFTSLGDEILIPVNQHQSLVIHAGTTEEGRERLSFLGPIAAETPEHARLRVAEFITRVNFSLAVGHLEMDFVDGETRYRSTVESVPEEVTVDLIRRGLGAAAAITLPVAKVYHELVFDQNLSPSAAALRIQESDD